MVVFSPIFFFVLNRFGLLATAHVLFATSIIGRGQFPTTLDASAWYAAPPNIFAAIVLYAFRTPRRPANARPRLAGGLILMKPTPAIQCPKCDLPETAGSALRVDWPSAAFPDAHNGSSCSGSSEGAENATCSKDKFHPTRSRREGSHPGPSWPTATAS